MNWYELKSYEKYECNREGEIRNKRTKRIVKGFYCRGKFIASLHTEDKIKQASVGRVVYETLIGDIPKGMIVYHKNHLKADNSINNLELMTKSEFSKRVNKRKGQPVYKIDPATGKIIDYYNSIKQAAKENYIADTTVSDICDKKIKNSRTGLMFRRAKNNSTKFAWEG